MKLLGLRDVVFSRLAVCLLSFGLLTSSACKSDGGGNDNAGGDGGGGGDASGGGGRGGSAGGGTGGNSGGTAGGDVDAGVPDAGPPPPPDPVIEPYAAPTGKLPISLSFKTADELNKNFAVIGDISQSADSDGVLKVAKGKEALITYDTTPDKERTNTFESFTLTVKFHSEKSVHNWVTFATDKNRNDGQAVGFGLDNDVDGDPGVSDVDNIFFGHTCWAVSFYGKQSQCATETESYGWTAWEPSSKPQTLKLTVKADKETKSIRGHGEFMDETGALIDGSTFDWSNLNRVNGEISFGLNATNSDAYIDEITIKEAEAIPETGIVRVDDGDTHIEMWVPPMTAGAKLKGLILTDPELNQFANGVGDFALFEHLRKFATAWGWGLVGGVRGGPKDFAGFFKTDMDKLKAKTGRAELDTVPVFIHSLLDTLTYQALADDAFNKRLIGFFADKPRTGGDLNAGTAEKYEDYPMTSAGRSIPGFIAYSSVSAISRRASMFSFWQPNRFFEEMPGMMKTDGFALWAFVSHGPQTNAVVDSWMLYLAFLQELIKVRTNNNDGTTPLKAVDRSKGYLGLSDFFTVAPAADVSKIEPFALKGFDPPPAVIDTPVKLARIREPQKDFLLGESTALVWQAFDYYKSHKEMIGGANVDVFDPKQISWSTPPKHGTPMESRKMVLRLAPGVNGWSKIEFYDSASSTPLTPLGKVDAGGATEFEYKNLSAGAHNFVAKLTMPDGKIHMTHPVMAIFAP